MTLEHTFIEFVNPRKSNIIVGAIYRNPSIDHTDFNINYVNRLLEKISKELKFIFLLGVNRLITITILKQIGIILRTYRNKSNPLFL